MARTSGLRVRLARNLRRSIMRGHPWIYKEAIVQPGAIERAQVCQVIDPKGELAWAIYDPHGPLSLRILSTEKSPPSEAFFASRFARAFELRSSIRAGGLTNAYRLFNGEGDLLPGLVCDIYGSIAVLQFDGQGPAEYWDKEFIAQWLLAHTPCKSVIEKGRRGSERRTELLGGEPFGRGHQGDEPGATNVGSSEVEILENGVRFSVDIENGQKTGFFLDQRENRKYLRQVSYGKTILNLFSYSGGFSVYAGLGGARKVASLDIAKGAIDLAARNWELNGLDGASHEGICLDAFQYLNNESELWDHIVVDPPSMSHSENQKEVAKAKYVELFAAAAKCVRSLGEISLSSCSSHISFDDIFAIIEEALSNARRRGQILRVSGQGSDHPFPHVCHELRYLKFVHMALD